MNIFISVLFICANLQCEFQQATQPSNTIEECQLAGAAQRALIIQSARLYGQSVEVEATCVTVRIPTTA